MGNVAERPLSLEEIVSLSGTSKYTVNAAIRRRELEDQTIGSVMLWIDLLREKEQGRRLRRDMLAMGWKPPKREERKSFFSKWRSRNQRYQ
jgi:hypothetical protein